MKITLKNISYNSRLSEETAAFVATIYVDGVMAGEVRNQGRGGPNFYHWVNKTVENAAEAYVKTLPPVKTDFESVPELSMDMDLFIGDLLEKHLLLKQYKSWIKKHTRTVFRLKTDEKGTFRILNMPYTIELLQKLMGEHGENLDVVVNKIIAEAA
jgi:hypothetical protein